MSVPSRRTMAVRLVLAVSLLLLFSVHPAAAQDPGGQGWEKKSNGDCYNTYARKTPDSGMAEVKLVGEIPATPAQCFSVVTDYAAFPKYMPYIDFTRVIAKDAEGEGKNVCYVFFYVEPPLISPRYYTLALTDEKDPDGVEGAFRSSWVQDNGQYRMTPDDPALKGQIKDVGDAVETRFNKGCWFLRPMPGGRSTQVTYYVYSDPGGSIPSWVANRANTVALPKLWDALVKRCEELYGH